MVAWTLVPNSHDAAQSMWLMQDGTVLVLGSDCQTLGLLHPDSTGSYANGWWSDAGQFQLAKLNFSSAVLSDGRLVACGGEQTGPGLLNTESNFCEIYDPVTQKSTQFKPPPGWDAIGDSPCVVLPDGTFLLGNTQGHGRQVALLNASNLTWSFGGGESAVPPVDADSEQGWALLQTGDVLSANTFKPASKRYDPSGNAFVTDAALPIMLGATVNGSNEIGPGIVMMNGKVIWFGATGHTCIYTPGAEGHNGSWIQGPDIKLADGSQLICSDTCAILEPNGKVFVVAWSQTQKLGAVFLEYDPVHNKLTPVSNTPFSSNAAGAKMLLLPNGHGLVPIFGANITGLYDVTFDSGSQASWAPTITSFPSTVAFPPTAPVSKTVTLTGTQLCGLSECQHFGDDNQQAEHYPMVRFIDGAGVVTYARAHDVSTRSIAPNQPGSVLVDIPPLAPGTYHVEAVAMGIPSRPATIEVLLGVDRNSCLGLVASLEQRLLDRGPKVRVAERAGIIAKLAICYQDGSLDKQEHEHALVVLEEINAPIQQP